MEESILISVKQILGIPSDYEVFDLDVITHINTAFSTLRQLGIGPVEGFSIEDDTAEWADFYEQELRYNSIRTYIFLVVKRLFDPPSTGFLNDAMSKQIQELEWRLRTLSEEIQQEQV